MAGEPGPDVCREGRERPSMTWSFFPTPGPFVRIGV
jgi:hypothetical protein